MHKLRPSHVYLLQREGLDPSDRSKPLVVSIVRKMQFMLIGCLNDAVDEGKRDVNPLGLRIKYAKKLRIRQRIEIFTSIEYQEILADLNYVEDKRWEIFPYLYGLTGLLEGEIAALQGKDFDLTNEYPLVRASKALEWSQG